MNEHGANVGVIVGIVTPDNVARNGQIISAGRETLTNPFGKRLELNERTPFEIGSISKVFTSGIHYMLHGNYDGTLGSRLGRNIRLSEAMAAITIKDLAIYRPGLAQDNRGGVYPPGTMTSLPSLFRYMANFTPPSPPGSCYAYSNVGWSLLGMAAVGLDSADTQEFVRTYNAKLVKYCSAFSAPGTQVFDPDIKPRLPQGYSKEFAPLPPTGGYQPTPAAQYASGGIVSNGADMMRFLLYSMGRLPGGLTDAALKSQQAETFRVGTVCRSRCRSGDQLWLVPRQGRNPQRRGRGRQQERRRCRLHVVDGIFELAGHRRAVVARGVRAEQQSGQHAARQRRHEAAAARLRPSARGRPTRYTNGRSVGGAEIDAPARVEDRRVIRTAAVSAVERSRCGGESRRSSDRASGDQRALSKTLVTPVCSG